MRVIINGIAALERKTGVGYYIDSLYRELITSGESDSVVFYPQGVTRKAISLAKEWLFKKAKKSAGSVAVQNVASSVKPGFKIPSVMSKSREVARNFARRACHKHFQKVASELCCDLYHEPNYLPWPSDLPTVTTILDLSVLLHPEWHPADRVAQYEKHFFRCLNYATHFISISEFTRREMIDNLGISPKRVTAIHIGVRPGFRKMTDDEVLPVLKEMDLQPGYLLYVSTIEPRKNLLTLMKAYCRLPRELRERHPLVLAGGWGWKAREILDFYEQTGRQHHIRHFGYVPDSQLPALYNGAAGLVYPSHYEGFGLPPVEMLACGGAVLASTAESLVEVLQGQAHLTDANDEDGWVHAMQQLLTNNAFAMKLRDGAESFAAQYSWADCARQTWNVYRRISGRSTEIRAA